MTYIFICAPFKLKPNKHHIFFDFDNDFFYSDDIPGDVIDVTRGTIPAVPTNRTDVMCLLGADDVTGKKNRSLVFSGLGDRNNFNLRANKFSGKLGMTR